MRTRPTWRRTSAAPKVARSWEIEGGVFAVDERYNANTLARVSYLATTPADRGMTVAWTDAGGAQSTYVAAGSSQALPVVANTYGDVTDVTLYPDALP